MSAEKKKPQFRIYCLESVNLEKRIQKQFDILFVCWFSGDCDCVSRSLESHSMNDIALLDFDEKKKYRKTESGRAREKKRE